jgi:hypothetical protein
VTDMSASAAVKRDLERLPTELAESGLAATALALADRLDSSSGSPSECAKALTDVLMKLRDLAPPEQERTRLDELKSRRVARLARSAAGKD